MHDYLQHGKHRVQQDTTGLVNEESEAQASKFHATPQWEPNFVFVEDILFAGRLDDKIYFWQGRRHTMLSVFELKIVPSERLAGSQ